MVLTAPALPTEEPFPNSKRRKVDWFPNRQKKNKVLKSTVADDTAVLTPPVGELPAPESTVVDRLPQCQDQSKSDSILDLTQQVLSNLKVFGINIADIQDNLKNTDIIAPVVDAIAKLVQHKSDRTAKSIKTCLKHESVTNKTVVTTKLPEAGIGTWVKVPASKFGIKWASVVFECPELSFMFCQVLKKNVSAKTGKANRLRPWIAVHPAWQEYELSLTKREITDWRSPRNEDTPFKTWACLGKQIRFQELNSLIGRYIKIPVETFGKEWAKHTYDQPDKSFQYWQVKNFDDEQLEFDCVKGEEQTYFDISDTLSWMTGDLADDAAAYEDTPTKFDLI
jgi:hypothetical protein